MENAPTVTYAGGIKVDKAWYTDGIPKNERGILI